MTIIEKAIGAVVGTLLVIGGFVLWLTVHDKNVADEARTGYVTQATLDASEAKRIKAEADAKFALQAADSARKQADNAQIEAAAARKKYDEAVSTDTGDDGAKWTDGDIDWLRQH